MLFKHLLAKRLDLAEGNRGHAGPFQAEAETTDAAEQVQHFHPCALRYRFTSLTASSTVSMTWHGPRQAV